MILTLLQYGNEPGIGINYTRAAMLIRIPPYNERYAGRAEPKSIWEGIKLDPADYADYGDDSDAFEYSSYEESGEEDEEENEEDEDEDDEDEDADEDDEADGGVKSSVEA